MRKKLIITLCFMFIFLMIPGVQTAFAGEDDYDTVRVKISIGTPSEQSFFVDGNYDANGVGLERQLYTVKLENGGLNLYCGSSLICSGASIRLVQHAPTSGRNNFIWMHNTYYNKDYSYTGDMEFAINGSQVCIMAINHVYIEDYLCGVVPYEMSDSWPAEALRAQAVAARNYVISYMGGSTYDVDDTSSCQVFKGYDASLQNTIAAVKATGKQVLTYNGSRICTYFSASNGGWSEIPLHVWSGGTDLPYYQIVEDPYDLANPSSLYETVYFPNSIDVDHPITTSDNVTGTPNVANAVAYIKQAIVGSGRLAGLGVDSADDFELTGVTGLIAHTPDTDGAYNDRGTAYSTIQCVDYIGATGNFSVNVGGTPATAENVNLDLRYFDGSNGDATYKVFNKDSLRIFVIKQEASGYSISQKRYGHGIGLSQRGAQQRANSGQSYQQILSFYYPGTALTTMTYSAPSLSPLNTTDSTNASVSNTSTLNVRSGPSTSAGIRGKLPGNARINITQESYCNADGYLWHQINYGGQFAYVAADYVTLDPADATIRYQTHIQNIGWQSWKNSWHVSGTIGQSLQLEALRVQLNGLDGGIEYRTHVQNIGWMNWVSNGQLSGTEGQSLQLEALQMRLTGNAANQYDLYYRVHAENIGWMDWARNGASAGTAGFGYRLEAIQIIKVPKGGAAPGATTTPFREYVEPGSVKYQTHVQNIGWQDWKSDGEIAGTSGQSLRLESIRVQTTGIDGGIEYRTHVQNIGWMNWVSNGQLSGTEGRALRLEAIQMRLTGNAADQYDLYYRVHAQNIGWMDWARNGASAGTAGLGYRLEAIQIIKVPKGGAAPGATKTPFREYVEPSSVKYQTHVQNIGWQDWKSDGETAGTSGQSLRLESIRVQTTGIDGGIEYRTHVQNIGWMNWVSNGQLSGTEGRALRLEAIQMRLTGSAASQYDLYYRVHAENIGWMDWAKNGASAGTAGLGYRLEAIQIIKVPKGGAAPGSTATPFREA